MTSPAPALLDELSAGVIHSAGGVIVYMNVSARMVLPQLAIGSAMPAELVLPENTSSGSGCVNTPFGLHAFSASRSGQDQFTLLRPVQPPEQHLTQVQIDGALRQLRGLMGDVVLQLAPLSDPKAENYVGGGLIRSYYRLFRLVDNADFLNRSQEDLAFHPVLLDLAGLCRGLCRDAGSLLAESRITLRLESPLTSLLVQGDGPLLQRMLLELISNSAKASQDKQVVLSLTRYRDRALLAVGNCAGPETAQHLISAMSAFQSGAIPHPGQGAGLGLAVARQIALLHGGSLMAVSLDMGPCVAVSLPIRPGQPCTTVESPRVITDGGLDPLLTGLCDVLPSDSFTLEGLD